MVAVRGDKPMPDRKIKSSKHQGTLEEQIDIERKLKGQVESKTEEY